MSNNPATTSITTTGFGQTPDGTTVDLFTLCNNGIEVQITNYGGTVTSILTPDRHGQSQQVVLGYDSLEGNLNDQHYLGVIVGRYGNRIARGKFSIDDKEYTLEVNNMGNHLHGGIQGFHKVVWNAEPFVNDTEVCLKLTYTSKHMEEGYPGTLTVQVMYTLKDDCSLRVDYAATTDQTTVVNLTNHSYFNLTGGVQMDVLNHELTLNASHFLKVDEALIPTGELVTISDTPMDFTSPQAIGLRIDSDYPQLKYGGGYDHCFVLNKDNQNNMGCVGNVYEPKSGRVLEVWTTEPAVQFYAGNFLDNLEGRDNQVYKRRYGFCLETQHYPDSPNQPNFPTTILHPGEKYQTSTVYRFLVKE